MLRLLSLSRLTPRIGLNILLLGVLILTATGCRTAPPMKPVNLDADGWTVRRGQALWTPKSGAPELAGFLLIASNPPEEEFIRFSKDPMEIVLARRSCEGWLLNIPAFGKSYSYRGKPPRRILWFQLVSALNKNSITGDWEWSGITDGCWRLRNPRTGERLEGFLTE